MKNAVLATATAALVAACGDPLADVEKLSDVTLAEGEPARGVVAASEEHGRNGGFFSRLFDPYGSARKAAEAGVQRPAFSADARGAQQSRGALGRGGPARRTVRTDARAQDVPYGTVLPFAAVARVCDARNRAKGRRIKRSDAGYTLHDTAPRSTGLRTFYVTGFADGCPRQFTAALAMLGAPSMHEQLRYGQPSGEYPYSDTDRAYEKVKSAICRVGRRTPCGNRIGSLERNTVFISTYERFSHNGRWADILVHDGAVLAVSLKDP